MKTILTIVGARPQFVKAAAVSRAIEASPRLSEVMLHTGQHFDDNMSDIFFRELSIPRPSFNLNIHGSSHGEMTGRMMEGIERVLLSERPSMVLVYGDTNSTLAGALAAVKLHIPIAHVEAGLRSFNRRMPEEINRILTDHASTLLFCPTRASISNLEREGIRSGVHQVGDVMFDATIYARKLALSQSTIVEQLGLPRDYVVCTLHRAENTDDPTRLRKIVTFVEEQAKSSPVVLPIHPRTRKALAAAGITTDTLRIIDPVGYIDMNRLLASARQVITDSGGLQKEAYFHGVPCITLREETEWVETIEHGWNRLWQGPDYTLPRSSIADYGTGEAAGAIAHTLDTFLHA